RARHPWRARSPRRPYHATPSFGVVRGVSVARGLCGFGVARGLSVARGLCGVGVARGSSVGRGVARLRRRAGRVRRWCGDAFGGCGVRFESEMLAKLSVKVVPRASRDEIVGWLGDRLKVKIAAPPQDGRANAALEAFLAQT